MNKKLTLFLAAIMLFTNMFLADVSIAKAADMDNTVIESTENAPDATTPDAEAPKLEAPDKNVEPLKLAPIKKASATLYSSNIVTFTWSKAKNVDGYTVYEKKNGNFKKIRSFNKECKRTYKIKNVTKGKTHIYAVRSFVKNADGYKYSPYKVSKVYVPKVLTKNTKGYKNTTSAKLINTAKTKLGCPYIYGSNGPNAFDCSGYVYYITKKADVSTKKISRTSSSAMWNDLKEHSIGTTKLSKAQPGDIVFLSATPYSGISHVAFYYGDDKYIHATSPGCGVEVTCTKYYGHVQGIVRLPNM